MGKSTISIAIFHCYVSSPEGNLSRNLWKNLKPRGDLPEVVTQALLKKGVPCPQCCIFSSFQLNWTNPGQKKVSEHAHRFSSDSYQLIHWKMESPCYSRSKKSQRAPSRSLPRTAFLVSSTKFTSTPVDDRTWRPRHEAHRAHIAKITQKHQRKAWKTLSP